MEIVLALLVGMLSSAAVYLMLSRQLLKFVFGLILLGNAANLALFAGGRLTEKIPALVPPGMPEPPTDVANALPQALILTAIVIGFGLLAFALALMLRAYKSTGSLDMDALGRPAQKTAPSATPVVGAGTDSVVDSQAGGADR